MDVKSALFYTFSAVLLFAAFRVITARNPVHAALYLVLAFFPGLCAVADAARPSFWPSPWCWSTWAR
jgi:NADH:ubiquinone oxidoreductase subunit 6 (subunit J)